MDAWQRGDLEEQPEGVRLAFSELMCARGAETPDVPDTPDTPAELLDLAAKAVTLT